MSHRISSIALFGLVLGVAACSAKNDAPIDTNASLSAFRNPTGSFTKETGAEAFSGYGAEKKESGKISRPGASSGTSRTQGIRLMNTARTAEGSCGEGQKCACPGGGTLVYQAEQSSVGAAAHFQFDSCIDENGSGFDGEAVVIVANQPILGIAKAAKSTTQAGEENVFFAAKGTAIEDGTTLDLEFALLVEAGYTLLAVEVADGKIVVGSAPDGSWFVKAKQGSFHCSSSKGKMICTSDESGEEIDLDAPSASEENASGSSVGEDEEPLPEEEDGEEEEP